MSMYSETHKIIDLRSDTVTKPTPEMRARMHDAEVGDDVMEEDPTVNLLQTRSANLFKKHEALFFPSGTMCNLCALLAWCNKRGSEVILGDKSHIFLFEQSGAAQFGGIAFRTIPNLPDGTFSLDTLKKSIREEDIHEPTTQLICIENTHNVCGGTVLPLEFLENLKKISEENKLPIHMDGARLWNAITAQGCVSDPSIITRYVDSISVCLSKGLGAPVGSVLIGSPHFIQTARRIRKALGGGMRQSGVLAAAGLQALDDFERGILARDHKLMKELVRGLADLPFLEVPAEADIHTNILFVNVVGGVLNANYISRRCRDKGICISAWSSSLIRMVIHRDIQPEDIQKVIEVFRRLENITEDFDIQFKRR